jgi:glycine/D-amino acid oxidase-like deaminating enzyme
MKLTSYWLDTSQPFDRGSPEPLEGHCDVTLVGVDLTGSSAALALAKNGGRVALLEAQMIGNAACGRNGGMCNNGFAQNYAVMAGKYCKDAPNALYRAFDGVDMVERLVEEKTDRLQLRPRRQAQARRQARALRHSGAQPGAPCGQRRSRDTDDRPAPTWAARSGPTATMERCFSRRAPGCMSAASSMGYRGHGAHMSTLMGSIMAEVMDGRPNLNAWTDFDRPAIPGYFGCPWFLPIRGPYYRMKDLVT